MEHRVLIGACGWEHAGWQGAFYPDDLPADWRLGYYANLHPVVLAPADAWLAPGTAARARAEAGDGLLFLAEVPQACLTHAVAGDGAALEAWLAGVTALGEYAAGLVLPSGAPRLPSALLQRLDQVAPLAIEDDLPGAEGFARVWHGPPESPQLDRGRLALARIASPAPPPRDLRAILEALLAAAGERRAVLLVDGEPPDPRALETAGVILDLL